jgi:hypothetical protein
VIKKIITRGIMVITFPATTTGTKATMETTAKAIMEIITEEIEYQDHPIAWQYDIGRH